MKTETQAIRDDIAQLAVDARALMAATADAAENKIVEARSRLAATLDRGKAMCGSLRDGAVEKTRSLDVAVREHPYEAIVISLGLGMLAGLLLANRRPVSHD